MNAVQGHPSVQRCEVARDELPQRAVDLARPMKAGLPQLLPAPTASATAAILYVDPKALTRDCIGRWLRDALDGYEITPVEDLGPTEVQPLAGKPLAVLVNGSTWQDQIDSIVCRINQRWADVPVILLAEDEAAESVLEAVDLGIRGYIPTNLPSEVVLAAVRLVCAGGTFVPAAALLAPIKKAHSPSQPCRAEPARDHTVGSFTERQTQILACLRRGMANKHIAYELDMRESTVKVHIRNIMKKLRATNRTQVVYLTRPLFEGAD